MQLIPSPVYPSLQVHVYDPGVLVHRALSSQGDCETHSSTSTGVVHQLRKLNCIHCTYIQYMCNYWHLKVRIIHTVLHGTYIETGWSSVTELRTSAVHSISSVPFNAGTCVRPRCVGAQSIIITRRLLHTLINIYKSSPSSEKIKLHSLHIHTVYV